MKQLPVYLLDISDDPNAGTEVNFVALVDRPAIKMNWQKFEAMKEEFFLDTSKHIISGPLMIADMLIYRKDKEFGEYNAVFTAETIAKIAKKFFQKGFQSNVNLMHSGDMPVPGAVMFESWIVDRANGKMPMKGYEDVPDGSWFGSFLINDPTTWTLIENGDLKGFSVEGLFQYKPQIKTKFSDEEIVEKIREILFGI